MYALSLTDHPVVRAAALEMAREMATAFVADDPEHPARVSPRSIAAFSRLLSDFRRPASMDWWARWLAQRYGLPVGPTAPSWGRYTCGEHCVDGDTGRMEECDAQLWSLYGLDGCDPILFADCGEDEEQRILVPGISAVTDPAEALEVAVRAALA